MPNFGLVEFLPDYLPFIGHLDELAVTFLMTHFLAPNLGKNGEQPDSGQKMIFLFVGGLALLYLVYPSIGTLEFIPDAIPFAGNLDEILASLILAFITNSVRGSDIDKLKNSDNPMVVEGELVNDKSGQS